MGKRGKGELNENGEELLQMCERNKLFLSNTRFNHKKAHRTTWQSPENPEARHKDGTQRRNPIRNQIDYMIFKQDQMRLVTDARSYSGMLTKSDHRLVVATMKGKTAKFKKPAAIEKIDFEKLSDPQIKQQYNEKLSVKMSNFSTLTTTAQEKWNFITQQLHDTAKETLGFKTK